MSEHSDNKAEQQEEKNHPNPDAEEKNIKVSDEETESDAESEQLHRDQEESTSSNEEVEVELESEQTDQGRETEPDLEAIDRKPETANELTDEQSTDAYDNMSMEASMTVFTYGDETTRGVRWTLWLERFKLSAAAKKLHSYFYYVVFLN